jgi:hypothetical protein
MSVRVLFLVLSTIALLSLGYSLTSGASHSPAINSIPLRVPVHRPMGATPSNNPPVSPMHDPRAVAPSYNAPVTALPQPGVTQTREIFKPFWVLYSVLTIPFKLVSVAVYGKVGPEPANAPVPHYLPMRPPAAAALHPPVPATGYRMSPHSRPDHHYLPVR